MGWIGNRHRLGDLTPPYYDPVVGAPINNQVPQWPTPHSRRSKGEWRWLTEPKRRPMAQRVLCRFDYSHNDPALQAGEYDFTEFCWLGLFDFNDFILSADSGVSPWGSRVKGDLFLQHTVIGEQPSSVLSCWDVTAPRSPSHGMNRLDNSVLWRIPNTVYTSTPGGSCGICLGPMPGTMGVSVDGVTASGDLVSTRDTWANGSYDISMVSACGYTSHLPLGSTSLTPYSVTYELIYVAGSLPGTGRVQLTATARRLEQGFIEQSACTFVSADFPLSGGRFNCVGENPIALSVLAGQNFPLPTWDWSTATISVVDASDAPEQEADSFPYRRLEVFGFSECYPIETFTSPDPDQGNGFMSDELIGVMADIAPGQSISSGPFVNFLPPTREVGGVWWNPAGNANELVVPAPWNFIKVRANIVTGTLRTNFISMNLYRNGVSNLTGYFTVYDRLSGSAQNSALNGVSDWIAVNEGDVIQIKVGQTGGALHGTAGVCWAAIEGKYFVV